MIRIPWDLEEAVALLDVYEKNGMKLEIPNEELDMLTVLYRRRAQYLGCVIDEKFRNRSGLRMQTAGLHYVVTNGQEGLSNVSRVFYKAYDLYQNDPERFQKMRDEFYRKYSIE